MEEKFMIYDLQFTNKKYKLRTEKI